MASREALAIQTEALVNRIEARFKELTGLDFTPMPRTHKDKDILRREQLHNVANWLDRVPVASNESESDALASVRALVASGKWTKPELEALLMKGDDNGDSDNSADHTHSE